MNHRPNAPTASSKQSKLNEITHQFNKSMLKNKKMHEKKERRYNFKITSYKDGNCVQFVVCIHSVPSDANTSLINLLISSFSFPSVANGSVEWAIGLKLN